MPNSPDPSRRPRRFPLLPEYWQAAGVWLDAGGSLQPVSPVDAAAVILLRDSPDGVETYLTTHAKRSPFGPVNFPGGPVEAGDDDPLPWIGPTSIEWGRRWNDDVGAARRVTVTAARELFEITGILLAGADKYSTVQTVGGRDWSAVRDELYRLELSLRDLLVQRHLSLRTDLLWPVSRWVTPEFLHRRFDIRYFAVILPERQSVTELSGHSRGGAWVNLSQLARHLDLGVEVPRNSGTHETQPESPGGESRDSWLGDALGTPATVGRPQRELLAASVACLIQDLAPSRSVVEVIARPGDLSPREPVLEVRADGGYELVVPPRSRGRSSRMAVGERPGW